jgi:hypothetical protein
MMMVTAAMSVVTMAWAVQAIGNDDRKNAYIALGITLLFGSGQHQPAGLLLQRHAPAREGNARPLI